MLRRTPSSKRTDTLIPSTTLFRSWRTPDIAPTMVILLTDMSPVFSKPARACSLRAVALGGPHQILLDLARRRHRQGVHEADNRGRLEMRDRKSTRLNSSH